MRYFAALSLLFVLAAPSLADEILFKNGDRLTGKIESAADGKLVITTKTAGKVTVDLKDVKTFSTEEPIAVKLQDGTVIKQKFNASPEEGAVETAPGGALQPQPVPISSIDTVNAPPVAWTGSIVINGAFTNGNGDTQQIGISADAARRTEQDKLSADAGYLYSRAKPADGSYSTSADNEFVEGEYDYYFTKKFFGYVNARVEKDRINDEDLLLTPGVGVGYEWYNRKDFHLETEGGLAWVYEKFTDQSTPKEDFAVRLAYHIDKSLWDSKVSIFHDLQAFPSISYINHFLLIADAGFHADLTETMFSEVKAIVNYDSPPAPKSVRTTTKILVGVGWKF